MDWLLRDVLNTASNITSAAYKEVVGRVEGLERVEVKGGWVNNASRHS